MRAKLDQARGSRAGVTLLEVLAVVAVVAVLFGLILPMLAVPRSSANHIRCIGHLKNVGLALRIFATDNTNAFPFQISTNLGGTREWNGNPSQVWRQFVVISNELSTPVIAICPSDRDRRETREWGQFTNNSHLSYFVGINAKEENPQSILAGDRNLTLGGHSLSDQVVTFPTNAAVGFDGRIHRFIGNIAMGDGSVQQVTSSRLAEQFHATALTMTNTLIVP